MINGDQEYRLERRNTPQGVSGTRRTFLFLTIFHSYPNISIASPSSWSLFINTFRCSRLHVSELVLIYIALHMNDFGCLQENWLQSSSQFYSNVKWVAYFCRTELQCFCVWSLCTFKQCLVFRPPLHWCYAPCISGLGEFNCTEAINTRGNSLAQEFLLQTTITPTW